jgi:hypothetical protein
VSDKPPQRRPAAPAPAQKPKTGTHGKPLTGATTEPIKVKVRPMSDPGSTISDFDDEGTGNKKVSSLDEIRRITGSQGVPRKTVSERATEPMPAARATAPPPPGKGLTARPNVLQSQIHNSGFDEEERTETSAVLGNVQRLTLDEDEDDSQVQAYDGTHPAAGVASIDTWKATIPPAQSMFGRRSMRSTMNVIAQFAAGHNPRYAPDSKGASRAHVFVWDVTRAMGVEIPHFLQGRELNIAQTVDWLRIDSHSRGWRKLKVDTALMEVQQGNLALVIPRDPKKKLIAILRERDDDNVLRVAAAVPVRGHDMPCLDALGTEDVEAYVHD